MEVLIIQKLNKYFARLKLKYVEIQKKINKQSRLATK